MPGPSLWVAVWDPDRDDEGLVDALATALERAGAKVRRARRDGEPLALFQRYQAFGPPGEELAIEPARPGGGPGGLVQFAVDVAFFEEHPKLKPAKAWGRFRDGLGRLLGEVRPLLAVCAVEFPVDELPDPPPETAEHLFRTGWVNPERLDEQRRRAFERALDGGPVSELAGGWWWSADPALDPAGLGAADERALTRALYQAWTERPLLASLGEEPAAHSGPLAPCELWFWAADRDDEQLLADVRAWAEGEGHGAGTVGLGSNGAPGWFPVTLSFGDDAEPAAALAALRQAVARVQPSWGALLPESGIAVPGLTPDYPSTGVLPNVWVQRDWIGGERLERLRTALDGAHAEELAGGVLLVTMPELLPEGQFAEWCRDPAARWDRLVDAAAILAEAARASRPAP